MAVSVRVVRRKEVANLPLLTVGDWRTIGREARELIIRRTLAGRDQRDQPFQAYSKGYAKQKKAIGASGRPNLQLSGDMLNAITVLPDEKGVTLSFNR